MTAILDHPCEPRPFSFESFHDRNWKCREQSISTEKDFDLLYSSVLEHAANRCPGISIDPDTLGGTPRIAGTRIPVYMILDAIEYYGDLAGAIKSYPALSLNQVKEALGFAVYVLEHPVEYEA
jgi:uncharacterized protein (DUF433 family)